MGRPRRFRNQTRRLPRTLPPRLLQPQPRRRRPPLLKMPKKRLKQLLLKPRRLPKLLKRLPKLPRRLPRLLLSLLLSLLLPRPAKDLRLSPPKDFRSSSITYSALLFSRSCHFGQTSILFINNIIQRFP